MNVVQIGDSSAEVVRLQPNVSITQATSQRTLSRKDGSTMSALCRPIRFSFFASSLVFHVSNDSLSTNIWSNKPHKPNSSTDSKRYSSPISRLLLSATRNPILRTFFCSLVAKLRGCLPKARPPKIIVELCRQPLLKTYLHGCAELCAVDHVSRLLVPFEELQFPLSRNSESRG